MIKQAFVSIFCALLVSPAAQTAELTLSGKTQTYCFGRYLVDITVEAELKLQESSYLVADIRSEPGNRKDFRARGNAASKNRKDENNDSIVYKHMDNVYPTHDDKQIVISKAIHETGVEWNVLGGGRSPKTVVIFYSIDAFAMPTDGTLFLGKYSFAKRTDKTLFFDKYNGLPQDDIDEVLPIFRDIFSSIQYRENDAFPAEPGFCIENGFIPNDGKTPQNEHAALGFWLKNDHSIRIEIKSYLSSKGEQFLLKEQEHAVVVQDFPEKTKNEAGKIVITRGHQWLIKRVRSGPLAVNGMQGEESLACFPTDNEPGIAHKFSWGTPGTPADPLKPYIRLEISTGKNPYTLARRDGTNPIHGASDPSSVDTEQIRKLYEDIVKTIRIRPTKAAETKTSAAPDVYKRRTYF